MTTKQLKTDRYELYERMNDNCLKGYQISAPSTSIHTFIYSYSSQYLAVFRRFWRMGFRRFGSYRFILAGESWATETPAHSVNVGIQAATSMNMGKTAKLSLAQYTTASAA